MSVAELERYDIHQKRDPDGKWGDGIPGPGVPDFDMGDFDLISEAEGTFGTAQMGVDPTGDVRLAWRDGGHNREMDLGADDVAELSSALDRLAGERDQLGSDYATHDLVDEEWFGAQQQHKVELYGSGVMSIVFGAEEDDPWTLLLDPPDEEGDDVQALRDGLDDVLTEVGRSTVLERKYNPHQLRAPGGEHGGQWVSDPAPALKDTLKLAGKVDLASDETLVGSGKVDGDVGGIRMALTEQNGSRMLRLGLGGEMYGQRNREDGIAAWDGNPARAPLPEADRQRLDAEYDALDEEYDSASSARQDEIAGRQADIREQLTAGDEGFNGTAKLDEYSMRRLADRIRPALADAVEQEKAENAAWDEIQALEARGNPDPARMAELRRIARLDSTDYITFTSGIVPGSAWGDVHYSVELDDVTMGPYVTLGVQPKGAPDDWGDGRDWKGQFDAGETRKFLRLLDQYAKASPTTQRAYSQEQGGAKAAPAGGQFALGGGRVGAQGKKQPQSRRKSPAKTAGPTRAAAPAGPLSFDGKHGTGYGIKGGDPRVRTLQSALNRLGLTDASGASLVLDGKYGPRTTAAVKKLQKALGLTADGQVTPELLKQASGMKQLPEPTRKPRAPRKTRAKSAPVKRSLLIAHINRALRLGVEVRHPLLFDRAFPLDDIQISRSGDGRTVEAYAACFDQPYEVRDQHGHYMEVIDRAAFNRTLSNGAGKSAMCLYNHGMNVVNGSPDSLAQVPLGTPVEIKADGRGLLTVTRYNKSALADSVLEAIRNGDIRSQSFRGRIVRSSPDRLPTRNRGGGLPTITRHELGLTDYGPTPIPVNAGAEIMAVRSLNELVQDFAALDDDGRLELLRTLGIDPDGDEAEELEDEAPEEGDDTPTSDESELGAEDPPAERSEARHSGRLELQRAALRAELILKGVRRAEAA